MKKEEFNLLEETYRFTSVGNKATGYKVNRALYCKTLTNKDNETNVDYKYKELVSFIKKKEDLVSKKAICIGYNPAKASDDIDITNKRLIDLLWDKYDGYLLTNLYPQV